MDQNQQQPSVQTIYAQPELTGGQKAAWLFIGMFINVAGILLAAVTNIDNPTRKSVAIKFAVIGFIISIVIGLIMFGMMGCTTAMMISSAGGY